jgi:hypothetical protein
MWLAGCGGFRRGWESVAWLEAAPAPPSAGATLDTIAQPALGGRLLRHPTFDVPGARLGVTVDNTLRTNDVQLYLFVLPLWWDPRDVFTHTREPRRTRVFVRVTPTVSGWLFRPTRARLHVGSRTIHATGGQEFGWWEGAWGRRPTGEVMPLAELGRTYDLSLDFATPVVSPRDCTLAVELGEALVPPQGVPPLPRVRFRGVRWREGYS